MQRKQSIFKIKGMQRDLSVSLFSPEFAYENKNIRITPSENNELLSINNEKGTKSLYINNIGEYIKGTPIGVSKELNGNIILFSSGEMNIDSIDIKDFNISDINSTDTYIEDISNVGDDYIYKLWTSENNLYGDILFKGNLNFKPENPIETITLYEGDNIQKVYWTDGINQLRVININSYNKNWNSNSFNFVKTINLKESITVNKISDGGGYFPTGTIQYVLTYFNKWGQESNIVNVSPLQYLTKNNKGESADKTVYTAFNITINNIDTSWEYVRLYSIIRVVSNSTPEVKHLSDIKIEGNSVSYTDTNIGSSEDPTYLLYVGGEELIAKTINHKDNTLFIGNVSIKRESIPDSIIDYFNTKEVNYTQSSKKEIDNNIPTGYYSYDFQLNNSSEKIKYFKYLEWYRFGIQFQHYTGKWSDPIWLCDKQNNLSVRETLNEKLQLPYAEYKLNDKDIIYKLISLGYYRVRPLIVYPSEKDRECICQGVLNPTVYNVKDRSSNTPFSQASWFFRPNLPFDINKSKNDYVNLESGTLNIVSLNSKGGTLLNEKKVIVEDKNKILLNPINKGSWLEFRHGVSLPDNLSRNAEIQCISNPPYNPKLDRTCTESDISKWVINNSDNYYIDQSIVTLNSPDIEFNDNFLNIDTEHLKLRIIGYIPISGFISDIDIKISTTANNYYGTQVPSVGFYKEKIGEENLSYFGHRSLASGIFWIDEFSGINNNFYDGGKNEKHKAYGFLVYPWHRNGSLNNTPFNDSKGYRSAMLKTKKMSNLKYSINTRFLNTVWNAEVNKDYNKPGCSVKIFNSNEVTNLKLNSPLNTNLESINYYGNIDTILLPNREGKKSEGYPIAISIRDSEDNLSTIFNGNIQSIDSIKSGDNVYKEYRKGIDPISIKYKSTPHAVITLNYIGEGPNKNYQVVLPTTIDRPSYTEDVWHVNPAYTTEENMTPYYFKPINENDNIRMPYNVYQDILNVQLKYGYLWLGELYRDNIVERFGGNTKLALKNNSWIPCGDAVSLLDSDVTIRWMEGDTYYQRYDCLKTYPFTLEDQNSIVEILSFMCETRINLDGRYDNNRGLNSNLVMTPNNFNLINKSYTQNSNFFNYRILKDNDSDTKDYKNIVTWSKTKTFGESVDSWTNLNMSSVLELDGDKGSINKIEKFNNELIVFQDSGISRILYNSSTPISTESGVPVELANSNKVEGKSYLSESIGCINKGSICNTPSGIYFIDNLSPEIYLFNGKLQSLSSTLGFNSWIRKNNKLNIWNPKDFSNIVTYYDRINRDVLFINKEECLAYSESLGQFSSFYSYENSPYFFNLKDKGIFIHKDSTSKFKFWEQNTGEYNKYFDSYKPFYTIIIANSDSTKDKIFDTIEFRADSWDDKNNLINDTFDCLETWNEYQRGVLELNNINNRPSSLKRKFRIWRANIPRDNRDRMRNPWLYLKLSKDKENNYKTVLQDIIVNYFV